MPPARMGKQVKSAMSLSLFPALPSHYLSYFSVTINITLPPSVRVRKKNISIVVGHNPQTALFSRKPKPTGSDRQIPQDISPQSTTGALF
jgi:hypothetical protein